MSNPSEDSIASEVLAASLGGAISASLLYPLEVLKTKMQSETKQQKSSETADAKGDDEDDEDDKSKLTMLQYAQNLYRTQGIGVFVHGFETSALQSAVEKALYFFAYTALKTIYGKDRVGTVSSLILGCIAEWAHLPVTLPLDCWTTKIQTDTSGKGAMSLLLSMLSEKGLGGMYKGIQAYVVLCLKPALQYTVFERIKAALVRTRSKKYLSAGEAFFLGMVARTVATVAVFPYVRAKVVLQTRKGDVGEDGSAKQTIPAMLGEMYRQGGMQALFVGLGPELTRGVLSSALMLMIKEQVADLVHAALYGNRQIELRHG